MEGRLLHAGHVRFASQVFALYPPVSRSLFVVLPDSMREDAHYMNEISGRSPEHGVPECTAPLPLRVHLDTCGCATDTARRRGVLGSSAVE